MGSRGLAILAVSVALGACTCRRGGEASTEENLVAKLKQGLASRDGKVRSYHLSGATRQMGQDAVYEFYYRAPNRMRGVLSQPIQRTFSFDGQRLFEMSFDDRRLTVFELRLPPAKSLQFLTQTFAPFTPDGFRVPLLLSEGMTAKLVEHPRGPQAVEVAMTAKDESDRPVEVSYWMRWPSLDFLAKRSQSQGLVKETRVEAEHCDDGLKLCFPKQLSEWEGKELLSTTSLSKVEINVDLANDSFTLVAPAGYATQQQELVETGPLAHDAGRD